jgi:hypothetical protein
MLQQQGDTNINARKNYSQAKADEADETAGPVLQL